MGAGFATDRNRDLTGFLSVNVPNDGISTVFNEGSFLDDLFENGNRSASPDVGVVLVLFLSLTSLETERGSSVSSSFFRVLSARFILLKKS